MSVPWRSQYPGEDCSRCLAARGHTHHTRWAFRPTDQASYEHEAKLPSPAPDGLISTLLPSQAIDIIPSRLLTSSALCYWAEIQ